MDCAAAASGKSSSLGGAALQRGKRGNRRLASAASVADAVTACPAAAAGSQALRNSVPAAAAGAPPGRSSLTRQSQLLQGQQHSVQRCQQQRQQSTQHPQQPHQQERRQQGSLEQRQTQQQQQHCQKQRREQQQAQTLQRQRPPEDLLWRTYSLVGGSLLHFIFLLVQQLWIRESNTHIIVSSGRTRKARENSLHRVPSRRGNTGGTSSGNDGPRVATARGASDSKSRGEGLLQTTIVDSIDELQQYHQQRKLCTPNVLSDSHPMSFSFFVAAAAVAPSVFSSSSSSCPSCSSSSSSSLKARTESRGLPSATRAASLLLCVALLILLSTVGDSALFDSKNCHVIPAAGLRPPSRLHAPPAAAPLATSYYEERAAGEANEPGDRAAPGAAASKDASAMSEGTTYVSALRTQAETVAKGAAVLAAEQATSDEGVAAVVLLQRRRNSPVISAWGAPIGRQADFASSAGAALPPAAAAAAFFSASTGSSGPRLFSAPSPHKRATTGHKWSVQHLQRPRAAATAKGLNIRNTAAAREAEGGDASEGAVFSQHMDNIRSLGDPVAISPQRKALLIALLCVVIALLLLIVVLAVFCYAAYLRKAQRRAAAEAYEAPGPLFADSDSGTSRTGVSSLSSRRDSDVSTGGGSAEEPAAGRQQRHSVEQRERLLQQEQRALERPRGPAPEQQKQGSEAQKRQVEQPQPQQERGKGHKKQQQLPTQRQETEAPARPAGEGVPGPVVVADLGAGVLRAAKAVPPQAPSRE